MIRVQMIGTQRSGSNLLRLMLDQSGALLGPPSAHELRDFSPLMPLYEPLTEPAKRARLANDLIEIVRLNALAWPGHHLDATRLLGHLRGLTLANFVIALYDQAATSAARGGWVNKCLENVYYIEALEAAGASPYYLHLVRDPRDVALSFRRAPIGPKDPHVIGATWRADQQAARAVAAKFPGRTRVQRFEDLVLRPSESLQALSSWLTMPYEEAALRYHERADAAEAATLSPIWSNLTKAPMRGRVAAHEREPVDPEFLRTVEEVTFDEMRLLGYEPAYAGSGRCLSAERAADAAENDARLRAETALSHAHRDQSAHQRRDRMLRALRAELADHEEPSK